MPRSRPARRLAASADADARLSPMCQVPRPSAGTCRPPGRVTAGNSAFMLRSVCKAMHQLSDCMHDKNWLVVARRWIINRKKQTRYTRVCMPIEIFLALLVFAFTTSITPGPNNMMLFASGVNFGFVRTIPHMCGIGVGFLVLLLAVGFGLGALLEAVPLVYTVLKFAGGAYLVWIAWKIGTSRSIGE